MPQVPEMSGARLVHQLSGPLESYFRSPRKVTKSQKSNARTPEKVGTAPGEGEKLLFDEAESYPKFGKS